MSSTGQSQSPTSTRSGPPYAPTTASLGGLPSITVDDPISAVFLFLFLLGAIGNMIILQVNNRRGHKFLASGALFGFCMARITTMTMRLVWSTHTTSVQIAIAATIFVNAGVVIIIVINLIFAFRILRASHPTLGWHKLTYAVFVAYLISIGLNLVQLIFSIVQQSYTLNEQILADDHKIQLVGATYNAVAAFLPIPITLITILVPKRNGRRTEKFGTGRFRNKVYIILLSSVLISIGAGFRCGVGYAVRPANNPAWWHSKACFYVFNFTLEIIVVFLYIFVRVDKRFHVPNGASAPGHYAAGRKGEPLPSGNTIDGAAAEKGHEQLQEGGGGLERIMSDEEFLDDDGEVKEGEEQTVGRSTQTRSSAWDRRAEGELERGIDVSPAVRAA